MSKASDSETPAVFARRVGLMPWRRGSSMKHMTMTWDQVLDLAVARYVNLHATLKVNKWAA